MFVVDTSMLIYAPHRQFGLGPIPWRARPNPQSEIPKLQWPALCPFRVPQGRFSSGDIRGKYFEEKHLHCVPVSRGDTVATLGPPAGPVSRERTGKPEYSARGFDSPGTEGTGNQEPGRKSEYSVRGFDSPYEGGTILRVCPRDGLRPFTITYNLSPITWRGSAPLVCMDISSPKMGNDSGRFPVFFVWPPPRPLGAKGRALPETAPS